MESQVTANKVPKCQEYCEGNPAQFYCQECSAIFCKHCYDREHSCGNIRKSQHKKITELRAVCLQHQHTLDFFNLTLLQPMCVICKKENLTKTGNAHHVIDNIEDALPKLRALLKEKLSMAQTQLSEMSSELEKVHASAEKTAGCTAEHLKACFSHAKEILDARELELMNAIQIRCKEFLEGDGYGVDIQERFVILEEAMLAGESLLKKDSRLIAENFSQVYTSLSTYCPFEKPASTRLRFIIEFPQIMLDKLKQLGNVSAFAILQEAGEECDETNVEVKDPAILMSCDADAPTGQSNTNEKHSPCMCNQLTRIIQMTDQSTQTNLAGRKRKQDPKSPCLAEEGTSVHANKTAPTVQKTGEELPCPDSGTKRTRRGGELSQELNKCDDILTHLWACEDSWPFARAVDKKQFPDYYNVIKDPINLQIIKDKVRCLRYEAVVDFVCDMRRMFDNCRTYNTTNSCVYDKCVRLEKEFNCLLKEQFPNFENVFRADNLSDDVSFS